MIQINTLNFSLSFYLFSGKLDPPEGDSDGEFFMGDSNGRKDELSMDYPDEKQVRGDGNDGDDLSDHELLYNGLHDYDDDDIDKDESTHFGGTVEDLLGEESLQSIARVPFSIDIKSPPPAVKQSSLAAAVAAESKSESVMNVDEAHMKEYQQHLTLKEHQRQVNDRKDAEAEKKFSYAVMSDPSDGNVKKFRKSAVSNYHKNKNMNANQYESISH